MQLILILSLLSSIWSSEAINIELINQDKQFEEFITLEHIDSCSSSNVKTYMPYDTVTDKSSKQYNLIHNNLNISESGLLYDKYGFIAVALGSYYGNIGDRYIFTLDSGIKIPVIKADAKSDNVTIDGCYQMYDKSVIEFVIDVNKASEYYIVGGNTLINHGNFNNDDRFKGKIESVSKVSIDDNYIDLLSINFTINEYLLLNP